jgi:hypothetical protein
MLVLVLVNVVVTSVVFMVVGSVGAGMIVVSVLGKHGSKCHCCNDKY